MHSFSLSCRSLCNILLSGSLWKASSLSSSVFKSVAIKRFICNQSRFTVNPWELLRGRRWWCRWNNTYFAPRQGWRGENLFLMVKYAKKSSLADQSLQITNALITQSTCNKCVTRQPTSQPANERLCRMDEKSNSIDFSGPHRGIFHPVASISQTRCYAAIQCNATSAALKVEKDCCWIGKIYGWENVKNAIQSI